MTIGAAGVGDFFRKRVHRPRRPRRSRSEMLVIPSPVTMDVDVDAAIAIGTATIEIDETTYFVQPTAIIAGRLDTVCRGNCKRAHSRDSIKEKTKPKLPRIEPVCSNLLLWIGLRR